MVNILITGSNGFIGRALKCRLLLSGHKIFEMNSDSDITVSENFRRFEREHIDHVFHLAAKTFVPESWENPSLFYHTNVVGTGNVLEFCKKKRSSLTFISAYLYGQPDKLPISENDKVNPNNPYAHSKYLAEQLCEFYSKEFEMNITIFRPFNAYGKGQDEKFLIPYIIKQALIHDSIVVKDLTPKRDYIYVDDLIDAIMLSLEPKSRFAIYNIGTGHSISVEEAIRVVQNVLGINKKVVSDSITRKNEINDVVASISKIYQAFGWHPRCSFHEGIKRTVEYEKERCHADK